ncbi:hypothetical protein [Agrobacterium vitis]|uniref:hypothetical protein n=1 Tax=Agrobacterium vitis TaxID=373 RepID=UPI003D283BF5
MISRYVLLLVGMSFFGGCAQADPRLTLGGDDYVSAFNSAITEPAGRDAFLSGFSVDIRAPVAGSLRAVAADVDVDAAVGGDVEAAGLSVRIAQRIGRDLSAVGAAIKIAGEAAVGGNARLAGRDISIDAPIEGSLLAAAQTIRITGAIAGDARLVGRSLSFGPDAKIGGRLTYSAPAPIDIPASVISSDRIHYEPMQMQHLGESMGQAMPHLWPGAFKLSLAFLIGVAFLVVVAGLFFALAPRLSAGLQREALMSPFQTMGIGILGLAMLLGLLPVCVMTLIGIPFIPFVFLALLVLWVGGYLLGATGLTLRIYEAFRPVPDAVAPRFLLIGVGLIVIASLNFVPILGWLVNLAVMFLGLGAILAYAGRRVLKSRSSATDTEGPAAVPPR